MDVLKILSRGIKSSSATVQKPGRLPSAGAPSHAQLYEDAVGPTKPSKRRKIAAVTGDDTESLQDDIAAVDFFAQPDVTKKTRGPQTVGDDTTPTRPTNVEHANLATEADCRQTLQSHRLKLTLLSGSLTPDHKVSKSRKKAKVEPNKSKEHKSLHPQVLQAFDDLRITYNISGRLARNVASQSYKKPTEVQMASLPLLLDASLATSRNEDIQMLKGKIDFLAVAPTGSGKTLAFLIPTINSVLEHKNNDQAEQSPREIHAIIVAPTRELATQIVNEGRKLVAGTGVKIAPMKRGTRLAAVDSGGRSEFVEHMEDDSSSADEDEDPVDDDERPSVATSITRTDILVTTPMMLLNFLQKAPAGRTLPSVQLLVLDEADVLLDPLFREQTLGIWATCTNPELQATCWSATMGSNIEALVADQLTTHAASRNTTRLPLVRLVVGLKDSAVPNIAHKLVYTATEAGKLLALRQLLHPTTLPNDTGPAVRPPFLVFCQTIDRATALHDELRYDIPVQAGGSTRLAVLHSSLSDSVRSAIMRRFRQGEIWVLITTDILSRGVDFAGVNGVVSYDVPSSAAAYVHRAGRTGRAGREGGVAVTFYTKEDIPFVKSIANVIAVSEKHAGKTGSELGVHKWLLDALPDVKKEDKKKLKQRGGVEARRNGGGESRVSSRSAWERRKEHNRRGAIEGSKTRHNATQVSVNESDDEWGGLED